MTGGPLAGIRVVEVAGIGPTPHAGMLLGDWGADVVRLVRKTAQGEPADPANDSQLRNRTVIAVDLKDPDDVEHILDLVATADVLTEGFRPGVAERLGFGPAECQRRNSRLVYARMTGWGQTGPWAHTAGHDLNYIGITGVLATMGTKDQPIVPLNLIGDYAGGSMFLVAGILAALYERTISGRGQVIDAAIVDGASQLAHSVWSYRQMGMWQERRESNFLDGGTPWYAIYRCADDRHITVGAIENPFYSALLRGLNLDEAELPPRHDTTAWPVLRAAIAERFATRTRDEWAVVFDGTDACVAPMLTMTEALQHPQLVARAVIQDVEGTVQPMPAPRFDRSGAPRLRPPGTAITTLAAQAKAWSTSAPVRSDGGQKR